MPMRSTIILAAIATMPLAACGHNSSDDPPRRGQGSLFGLAMPSLEMPEVNVTRILTEGGGGEDLSRTTTAQASEAERAAIALAVKSAFPQNWTVRVLGLKTGLSPSGQLMACGIANATKPGGDSGWNGIFRTETTRRTGETRLRQIAGGGTDRLVAYSHCQALGLG
ncbi:MAG: hypothetical protein VYD57_17325 [Pseudomonadota bacterium]|nr:hypothetical protein [Pseudomonadota bacterium]